MIRKIFFTLVISMVLVFTALGLAYAGLPSEAPIPVIETPIAVDGDPGDWGDIEPLLVDFRGDSVCEVGTDIKALYLAVHGDFLYWRMDTVSGTFSLGTPESPKGPMLRFYEPDSDGNGMPDGGIATQIIGDPEGASICVVDGTIDPWHWECLFSGLEYGNIGAVAEGKIPLELFDDFEIKDDICIDYYRGPTILPCDEVRYPSPPPAHEGCYIHNFEVLTMTVDGGDPTTYFRFVIHDAADYFRPPYRDIVQSATITFPDSTEIEAIPVFRFGCRSEIRADDNNRNGIIEIDRGELESRFHIYPDHEIISAVTPHAAGTYSLQVTLEDGKVLTKTVTVAAGLTASEWPPVTDLQADMDPQTGKLHVSWTLPACTFPEDASIRIRIDAYQRDGSKRYIRSRIRKLPVTMTDFTLTHHLTDIFNHSNVAYFTVQVRVYSMENWSHSAIKGYAIDGYTVTPATIPEPAFLTQEETDNLVDQAVAAAVAAKDALIDDLNQIIADLEATIDSLFATLSGQKADESVALTAQLEAQEAIAEAIVAGGNEKEIEKAQKEMEKAQQALDHTTKDGTPDPKYDKAVDHFKKAWEHAQKAIEKIDTGNGK